MLCRSGGKFPGRVVPDLLLKLELLAAPLLRLTGQALPLRLQLVHGLLRPRIFRPLPFVLPAKAVLLRIQGSGLFLRGGQLGLEGVARAGLSVPLRLGLRQLGAQGLLLHPQGGGLILQFLQTPALCRNVKALERLQLLFRLGTLGGDRLPGAAVLLGPRQLGLLFLQALPGVGELLGGLRQLGQLGPDRLERGDRLTEPVAVADHRAAVLLVDLFDRPAEPGQLGGQRLISHLAFRDVAARLVLDVVDQGLHRADGQINGRGLVRVVRDGRFQTLELHVRPSPLLPQSDQTSANSCRAESQFPRADRAGPEWGAA